MAHAIFCGPQPSEMESVYWSNIDKYHLSYLTAEESPQKIAEKERLENFIKHFLGRIPHNRKFLLTTTSQIFQKSVIEVKDFSIVKLSHAWTVIGLYAQNLISQPWRREFHKIQMYSGYYEHNVRNILIDGEQMLIYMGYQHIGDGVMCLEGPVDPDRVSLVSKDCFIASSECQVMFQIYREMISRSINVTYEVIFHFREQNICDINKAIIDLSLPHHRPHSMYSSMGLPYNPPLCSRTLSPRFSMPKESMNPHYQWHGGPYVSNEIHPGYTTIDSANNLSPHHIYPTNGCSYSTTPKPHYQTIPPIHPSSVPTGQLIEYDSSHSKNHSTEKSHRRNSSEPLRHEHGPIIEDETDHHSKELVRNWLYYDELENERKELARKVCEEMVNVKVSDSSVHDLKGVKKKEKKIMKDMPSIPSRPVPIRHARPYDHGGTLIDQNQKTNRISQSINNPEGRMWECMSCTFHNKPHVDVCEMCDKSRIQGNEILPLISGGRECHTCTLVNDRGEEKCKACGECLKDSPTYI